MVSAVAYVTAHYLLPNRDSRNKRALTSALRMRLESILAEQRILVHTYAIHLFHKTCLVSITVKDCSQGEKAQIASYRAMQSVLGDIYPLPHGLIVCEPDGDLQQQLSLKVAQTMGNPFPFSGADPRTLARILRDSLAASAVVHGFQLVGDPRVEIKSDGLYVDLTVIHRGQFRQIMREFAGFVAAQFQIHPSAVYLGHAWNLDPVRDN